MAKGKILVIDDERRMGIVVKTALELEGHQVKTALDGATGLTLFRKNTFDVVISDLKMPGIDGIHVLTEVKKQDPNTEVILMTAHATAQTAVQAMKLGAYDYIIKPFEMDELRLKVSHILETKRLVRENVALKQELKDRFSLDNMVGQSSAMQKVYRLVEKVAQSDTTVLIRGESGTGKELVARAIHHLSHGAKEPFIAINSGALPESLLESELFGFEKGAFTGADRRKPGRFELAGNGTIFLDEIGDISMATQVKLLRVLQTHEFARLGATETLVSKARVIAATNRDLEAALKNNEFREDLYYRINVFPVVLPPLRQRIEDIPDLVFHFLRKRGRPDDFIEPKALDLLMSYNWPGNVRELENVIERALIMADNQPISSLDLPPHIRGEMEAPIRLAEEEERLDLAESERRLIQRALARAEGNKSKAAELLGITRRKLYSMMERLGSKK